MRVSLFGALLVTGCASIAICYDGIDQINNRTRAEWSENEIDGWERQTTDTWKGTRVGLVTFTKFCGPGSRLWNKLFSQNERTFRQIDYCCKAHDECPHFVERADDYVRYPGLEYRPQFFSRYAQNFHARREIRSFISWRRLQCECDVAFYNCLSDINSPYALSVGFGYSIFQRYCFKYEHPIIGCEEFYT